MSDLFCCMCLQFKEKTSFSKAQQKKKETRVCLQCMKKAADASKREETHVLEHKVPSVGTLFKPLYGEDGDKADKMMCLTMHQPWASLLVYGIKRVEGRVWNSSFRGRLWIHAASKEPDPEMVEQYEAIYTKLYRNAGYSGDIGFPKHYPTSALIGSVDIVDILPAEEFRITGVPQSVIDEEGGSPYVFLCQNYRRLLLPFSLSGDHKLWKLDPKDCAACRSIMKESISPSPVDFYAIMKEYYAKQTIT